MSEADTAERMSRTRTTLFYLSAALFILISVMDFPVRRSLAFTGIWVIWAMLLLANIAGIGGWLHAKSTRRLMEDEGTRANRSKSLAIGYFATMASALILTVVVRLVEVDVQTAILAVATAGISAALISFAALERLSMRDA
ncbi:hypothetical protein [Sphingomonas abietis]|uniref:DUF2178 domain-containing protein n=1 Tax=Sphingomonas abietis TaxID=3012344 RepID=A0ABY7NNG1_9SPHN|nr:hypothetical protein [Sphingomonas abietis]WBO22365.1 hypothetical protein PBT88_19865 [Sphingomonas abietis]